MSMPFYVAPEQAMKDKADYARKNIARGRPLVATTYGDGVLICAENPSRSLHKVSEIYDRIAFAGVGRYNEFDQLRRAGVQHADIKGYQFSREDVDAQSLANLYAQYMGNVFTHEMKPLEIEILVAEVGDHPGGEKLFHILYDGSVVDEEHFTVLGGEAEAIAVRMHESFEETWALDDALGASVRALSAGDRSLQPGDLEVAVLARTNGRRAFRRLSEADVEAALAARGSPPSEASEEVDPTPVAGEPGTVSPGEARTDGS